MAFKQRSSVPFILTNAKARSRNSLNSFFLCRYLFELLRSSQRPKIFTSHPGLLAKEHPYVKLWRLKVTVGIENRTWDFPVAKLTNNVVPTHAQISSLFTPLQPRRLRFPHHAKREVTQRPTVRGAGDRQERPRTPQPQPWVCLQAWSEVSRHGCIQVRGDISASEIDRWRWELGRGLSRGEAKLRQAAEDRRKNISRTPGDVAFIFN